MLIPRPAAGLVAPRHGDVAAMENPARTPTAARVHRAPRRAQGAATAGRRGGGRRPLAVAIVIFGVVERLVDPDTFDTVWDGMWWATQTVTTVGYGDVVPQ